MKEWFKDWFEDEDYLNVYGHRDDTDAYSLLKTILRKVNIPKNSKVLDAACGSGRHSIYLARTGYDVTGFDLSQTLLKVAKTNVEKQNLPINLFIADIRNVCSRQKFDLILNLFTSFGYFESDEENFRFIKRANGLLNNNGYFVLDYFNINYLQENLIPHSEKKFDNKVITEDRFFENGRVNKNIVIKDDNKTKSFIESVKLYDKDTILKNFEESGYKIEEIFGDYNGSEFNSKTSERLVVIFRK